jgi:hypothetical protein
MLDRSVSRWCRRACENCRGSFVAHQSEPIGAIAGVATKESMMATLPKVAPLANRLIGEVARLICRFPIWIAKINRETTDLSWFKARDLEIETTVGK